MVAKIDSGTQNSILRMWSQGHDKAAICRACHVSWPTVHRVVREWEEGPGRNFSRTPLNPREAQGRKAMDKMQRSSRGGSRKKG